MDKLPQLIHEAVSAGCPIDGISIGSLADKKTWIIQFSPTATQAQRTAAATVIANFDTAAEQAKEDTRAQADIVDADIARRDNAIVALKAMTPAQARAWVSANVNTLADAKSLLSTMAAILCVLSRRL